jgi:hypothetical protein
MPDTLALSAFTRDPTGPMCRVLRRMMGYPLVVSRIGGAALASVRKCVVPMHTVAGMIARDLIHEAKSYELVSEYLLTEAGRKWAATTTEDN